MKKKEKIKWTFNFMKQLKKWLYNKLSINNIKNIE